MKTIIALALLALSIVAYAQNSYVTPQQIADCPSKWFQVIDGNAYCIKGEAWEMAGKPVADPPVIISRGQFGAPIATICNTIDCGKTSVPLEHKAPEGWGGYPNMGGPSR